MRDIWIYRGIANSKKVWTGGPNGKIIKAPKEKGYYNLIETADENNNHVGYRWEKSFHTNPEVFFDYRWCPVPDTYWG